ncbi:MAG: FAD-binding oxidoreductase, partial [Chloroflexota bacterium]
MESTASLRNRLAGILDGDCLAPDGELGHYAVEGLVPRAAAFPVSEEQVSAALDLAAKEQLAVVPRGSGSLMALGGVPERVDVVLGLGRLSGSIEHAPADLTVTVGAGNMLASLQQTLAEEGQWLPLDPPLAWQRTVGGTLATGLAGPLSLAFGTARDMVIGMRVAGADGVITKSGGKVVKNATGFDVAKVHLGALGTLGIILEATFKVTPLPKKDGTLRAVFESLGDAVVASQDLMGQPFAPQAVEVAMTGANGEGEAQPGCLVYARFLGAASGIERRLKECGACLRQAGASNVEGLEGEIATQTWRWLADFGWDAQGDDGLLFRLGGLPSRVQEIAKAVVDVAKQKGHTMALIAGPGRGIVKCLLSNVASQQMGDVLAMVAEA